MSSAATTAACVNCGAGGTHVFLQRGQYQTFCFDCYSIQLKARNQIDVELEYALPPGRKDDRGKDPWTLLPWEAVREVVRVMKFGADRYGAQNWQRVENAKKRYTDAAYRHLYAYQTGDHVDADSGLHTLGHAACCVLFVLWLELKKGARDVEQK